MENLANRILLIDDNKDNLDILADLIHHAFPSYDVLTASSGLKGLALAASNDPDVILLDVVMPGMNGFEVCQKLKSDPKTSLIPVVFLTSIKGDREARLQAIEVGAEAFLSRPVDESELIAQIRAMQKIKRAASLLQDEKDNLTSLVALQTQTLQQTHAATLNLLEDLHAENEARKKNEEALRDSEDKFRYLFDYSVAPKSVTQLSGTMHVNQAFCDMLGYSMDELENCTWQELTHPDDVEMNQAAINSLLVGEKVSVRLTKRYIHKNGSVVWVDFGTALRRDKNGQPLYLISSFNDITERKQAEEALRESEQRFRTLFEKAPVAIYMSRNGVGLYANQKDLQMFGLSGLEEIIGRPVTDFLAAQSIDESLARTRRRGLGLSTPTEIETVALRPDGSQFPAQVTVASVQLSDGPANLSFITDITERKNAQALQEAVYKIAAAAENSTSLDELYPRIHQSISSVMTAENFYIALYDETKNLLQFPYYRDIMDVPFAKDIQPGQGMTAYVLRTGKSWLGTSAQRLDLERQGEVQLHGEPSAIWLGVPLIIEGKAIGAMVVQDYSNPRAYGEREQHILEFVSTQVATAITRKRAEEALRLRESYLTAILENQPGLIWLKDTEGRFLAVNRAFAVSCGKGSPEELTGRTDLDIWPKELPEKYRADDARVMADKASIFVEEPIIDRGRNTWFETFKTPVLDDHGNVIGTTGFSLDITERKQAQALQQAAYQIAAAAETAPSLDELYPQIHQAISSVMPAENFFIALYDETQDLLRFPYFKDPKDDSFVNGVQPGKGTTAYVLRTGKSLLCTRAVHAELERQGEVKLLGVPSAIWLGVPLIVEGKTIGAMVVQHYSDPNAYGEREQHMLEFVSTQVAIAIDRKQAEAALYESETRYRGLFEHSPVALWEEDFSEVKLHIEKIRQSGVTDFRAFFDSHPKNLLACIGKIKVLDVNAATLAMMHATSKDQLKGNLQQVIRIEPGMDFVDELVNIAEGRTEFAWDGINYTLDGERLAVSLRWSAAPGYENTLEKVLLSVMDITARKQAEDQVRQLNASLEQRVVERTRELRDTQELLVRQEKLAMLGQLAGGVGHELRNPLGVINSAVYYLKLVQPDADEKIKKYHLMIEQEVNTAGRIINDLLDFGRIVSPDRQAVSISELLQRVFTRFPTPPAVRVQLKLPANLPKVYADPLHMEQVLGNLTTNAWQAMKDCKDGGKLTISASLKKDQIAIAVKDTGTGITPESMQKLFEPLFTTKLRGIGLGLAVSKKLAEANGGCIAVHSEPGKGSTFTLYLPVKSL